MTATNHSMNSIGLKKVSVIIPAFNEEEHLSACLDTVTNVDYPKELLEIVIVDNGSTDRTVEVARRYTDRVFPRPSDNVSALRNFGAKQASGEILAFVDADCLVAQDWLRRASVYFNSRDVAVWGAPPCPPDDATWVQRIWYLVRQKSGQPQEVDWLESMNLFVRMEDFWLEEGFNASLVTCEDVDFCYRMRRLGKILSDGSVRVIHLGEAATLRSFVRKEIWRGRSNLRGVLSHGVSTKELPSLSIPAYFSGLLPLIAGGALFLNRVTWLLALLPLYLLPTLLVLLKVLCKKQRAKMLELLRLTLLLQLYFFARTVAVFKTDLRS